MTETAGPGRVKMTGPGPGQMKMAGGGGPKVRMGAGAGPGTNPADTSTAPGIMRVANSYCDARALLTGIELGLFTALQAGPASEDEIRDRLGLHGRGLHDWLELLAELGLLEREDRRYRNAAGADSYLVRGKVHYIGGHLERSSSKLYPAWGRLADALRSGEQQSESNFHQALDDPGLLAQFIDSMDALTQQLAPEVTGAYGGWPYYHRILDVGGCRGTMLGEIVKAHPHLTGAVFDLPQMGPFFQEKVAELGLAHKMTFHGGSFFTDPLPSADIVMFGHVLHDWDAGQRKFLLGKAYECLSAPGVLVVYDRMTDPGSPRPANRRASLNMLLMTDGGSEYPVAELRANAQQAGFTSIEHRPLGAFDTLLTAHKAG